VHQYQEKMLISRQVKSLASELKRVREQMEAMQRKIDTMSGTSIDKLAAVPHPRQGADKAGRSRDTFSGTDLYPHNPGPEPCSASSSRDLPNGNTSTYQASTNDDEIEDDPLDELATMAPLGKMVTDAETIPESQKVITHSFDGSPLSCRSGSHRAPENPNRLPGDPVTLGLISESRGRKLLEV
jgi:hypothetical protein